MFTKDVLNIRGKTLIYSKQTADYIYSLFDATKQKDYGIPSISLDTKTPVYLDIIELHQYQVGRSYKTGRGP